MQQTAHIIEMDEVKNVEAKALTLPDQARGVKVIDNATMEKANGLLMDIRSIRKEIQDTFKPLAEKAHAAHKAILEQQKRTEAPLIEAEGILKIQIRAYMDEVERLRREEERRLQEIARKEEEERRLAEALQAEAEGNIEEAKAILEEPAYIPIPTVKADIPKVDNRLFRKVWKFRVLDIRKVPIQYLKVDEIKVGQIVRAMKGETNIPGIQVYEE
jgi:hypothetical protein